MLLIGAAFLLSSCGTYTGAGAVAGGSFGAVLGSAIGGISGGWRGSDIGTVVGMAGGAAVGAAVGAAADQQAQREYEDYQMERANRHRGTYGNPDTYGNPNTYGNPKPYDHSGFDATNSGNDRIDFDGAGPRNGVAYLDLEIRNARFVDADHDGIIRRGEECQVTFEIMNRSSVTIYDVQPNVYDTTGNKHILISPNLHIESIAPKSGVRYTANILADRKLKDGTAVIRVSVSQGNREITSQVREFVLQTRKK